MKDQYHHQKIEKKWQKFWEKEKSWLATEKPEATKKYILDMFPYPSAEGLHVGHPEGYTASDIIARYFRMKGDNVLHPMGWDAFGLPAENYAIKTGTHPKTITEKNIKNFKRQIQSLGFSYDWSREINTTDPDYYRWTQWIFLQMFKRGLAYEAVTPINWCPSCKTGLANEEVVGGKCERCGTEVTKKDMRQWLLRITKYADRLLKGLDSLDWPEPIKLLQRNWIGRSEGALIQFPISPPDSLQTQLRRSGRGNSQYPNKSQAPNLKLQTKQEQFIEVFTTRADTLFGATYLVVAPEHPLVLSSLSAVKNRAAVEKYIEQAKSKSDLERTSLEKDKTGVELKGVHAINPATGKKISIWVSDYVLISYGTGAIMAVPAHDERDYAFAKKYKLPIVKVIEPGTAQACWYFGYLDPQFLLDNERQKLEQRKKGKIYIDNEDKNSRPVDKVFIGQGNLINSEQYNGLSSVEGGKKITEWLEKNNLGKKSVNYKLRDWVFSRQRYWGEPIPLIHCPQCKERVTGTPHHLNFYNQEMWQLLASGEKKVETRALNPHEQDRFFGRIKKGDYIKCVNKISNETLFIEVLESKTFKSIKDFYVHPDLVAGVRGTAFDSLEELQSFYRKLTPDYEQRIEKNGLITWRVKQVMPGIIPVPEDKLPVKLPDVKKYEPTGTGESPLAGIEDWVKVKCPQCKGEAKRETNTMPQWAGSCWYYLRYLDPENKTALVGPEKEKYWMSSSAKATEDKGDKGVDVYIGGAEHAVLHLMYARFWHMFLYDISVVSTPEPFFKLKNQGMILGEDGQKMSKSRGNVINPDEVVKEFGADSMRLYEMFMGPFEAVKPWSKRGIIGVYRFLQRVWQLQDKVKEISVPEPLEKLRHKLIKKITNDIETYNFNTAVSTFMETINAVAKNETIPKVFWKTFLILLKPFAPHLAEELWERLGHEQVMVTEKWPTYKEEMVIDQEVEFIIQVNGKLRDRVKAPLDTPEQEITKLALNSEKVKKFVTGEPKKIIFVKNKLINIVA